MVIVPSLKVNNQINSALKKRAFFFSFRQISMLKGSMSLEGGLVLPIFLFFIMTILLGIEAVRFSSDMSQALYLAGNQYSIESFGAKYEGIEQSDITLNVTEYLGHQFLPYFGVEGGSGGVILGMDAGKETGKIEITSEYRLSPFISWLPIGDIVLEDRFLGHMWTGYAGKEDGYISDNEEVYVYITKTGSKYHLSAECSSLKINVKAIDASWLEEDRNKWGGKYYPCEKCKPKKEGLVFVTTDGNSYHSSRDCSSLKRIVYIISLREATATGYDPCGRCTG